jgi:hypothetical protein
LPFFPDLSELCARVYLLEKADEFSFMRAAQVTEKVTGVTKRNPADAFM